MLKLSRHFDLFVWHRFFLVYKVKPGRVNYSLLFSPLSLVLCPLLIEHKIDFSNYAQPANDQ